MTILKYKGYIGSSEVDVDDNILHGKLLFIRDLITFEAETPFELKKAFEEAVDDYLADCRSEGVEPDKPCKGQFNVRVSPELHRDLALAAMSEDKSLNDYVQGVLQCHTSVDKNGNLLSGGEQNFILIARQSTDVAKSAVIQRIPLERSKGTASGWVQ